MSEQDALILAAYSGWSEEVHAAGFLAPDTEAVREFRDWLDEQQARPREPYEQRMLDEYQRQASI